MTINCRPVTVIFSINNLNSYFKAQFLIRPQCNNGQMNSKTGYRQPCYFAFSDIQTYYFSLI